MIKKVIILVCSVILISCTKNTSQEKPQQDLTNQTPISFTHQEQEFHIKYFTQEMLDYIKVAKRHESEDLNQAFNQHVVEPFRIEAFGKSAGYGLSDHWVFTAPRKIDQLEESIHQMINNQKQINDLITDALQKSADMLPGEEKTIYVFPTNPDQPFAVKEMGGVAGVTMNKNAIIIQIAPSYNKDILSYTVAHEYHHAVYLEKNEYHSFIPLIDSILVEGKADTFANMIYPNFNILWLDPFSPEVEEKVWSEMKDNLTMVDIKIKNEFHNGNLSKGIPTWSNYKMGYQIMADFLKNNPKIEIDKWTSLTWEEILELSRYEDRFSQ